MRNWRRVAVLLVLVSITSAGSLWAVTGGPKRVRVCREVREQLLFHLPKTMLMAGHTYLLEDVEVFDMTEGLQGIEMKVIVDWSEGMKTSTSAILQNDGFGNYIGQWNSSDLGTFTYNVTG